MPYLTLCVTYTAKPGMRDAFVQAVLSSRVLEKIREEAGCLGYEYYYSAENKDEILLLEKWDTKEHQRLHLEQPHMEVQKASKENYILHTRVERLFSE